MVILVSPILVLSLVLSISDKKFLEYNMTPTPLVFICTFAYSTRVYDYLRYFFSVIPLILSSLTSFPRQNSIPPVSPERFPVYRLNSGFNSVTP